MTQHHEEKKAEEKKPRTTAQLWSRRETLKKQIAEKQAEMAEIDAQLDAELASSRAA